MREKIENVFDQLIQERDFLRPFGNIGRLAAAFSVMFWLAAFITKTYFQ